MCLGGGGGGSDQMAKQAAADEAARQARIDRGNAQLKALFEGGTYGTGQLTSLDPASVQYGAGSHEVGFDAQHRGSAPAYYDSQGNPVIIQPPNVYRASHPASQWVNVAGHALDRSGGGGAFGAAAGTLGTPGQDQLAMEQQIGDLLAAGLYTGRAQSEGFQPSIDKAYQAQLDYALPQVEQQFQDAQQQLQYALARQGLLASSQGSGLTSRLSGDRALAIQGQEDVASNVKQKQAQTVEGERGRLTQLLQQTGDVQGTMLDATRQADILRAAPALETVGPLFQNATGTLADLVVSPAIRRQSGYSTSDRVRGYSAGGARGSGRVIGG